MTLRRLKWLAILGPLVFLLALEVTRQAISPQVFRAWPGYVLLGGIVLLATLLFAEVIFTAIGRLQDQLMYQNRELFALHEAGVTIVGDLDLDTVLQRVVDQARTLVGARYGALSYLREEGGIAAFLTSGITPDERAQIGPIPVGHGLLGVVLTEGQRLRLPDLGRDPRSVGFPPHHPPMRSLLAVPIGSQGRVVGNLYLTEKKVMLEFDTSDEETLERFATLAALAIENARLHRQVRALAITEERERIAREMHDSLAQVLGYVNTKAQGAQALLQRGQTERGAEQISQLAEAARAAYADVRESILGLRTSLDPERGFLDTLREYVTRWQEQSGVSTVLIVPEGQGDRLSLPPLSEVHLIRIIQEALTNVRKHANATRVQILVAEHGGWVNAAVEDDGVGFTPNALGRGTLPRFGLATMRERAEAIGGTFAVTATPGHGTRVEVGLPGDHTDTIAGDASHERAHR